MPIAPKHFYGQHFLRDQGVLDAIVEAANIHAGEVVLEIGPGEGALTERLLAAGARVVAVEVDDEAVVALRERFGNADGLTLVHGDVLRMTSDELREKQIVAEQHTARPSVACGEPRSPQMLPRGAPCVVAPSAWKLIANIPYNITGQLFRRFIVGEHENCLPSEVVFLIQKEVAERALATAGEMNMLALGVQLSGEGRLVRTVPPGAFFPPPVVQSAVFAWRRTERSAEQVEAVLRFAKPAFLTPRKKIRNTLAPLFGSVEAVVSACEHVGVSPDSRPEELSVEAWSALQARSSLRA